MWYISVMQNRPSSVSVPAYFAIFFLIVNWKSDWSRILEGASKFILEHFEQGFVIYFVETPWQNLSTLAVSVESILVMS